MRDSLLDGIPLTEVDEGIYSCLPDELRESDYDGKVRVYDAVVGNPIYNRVLWGNWPSHYRHFCERALARHVGGSVLDAGCGSLVFTAGAYARVDGGTVILLDRSIGMLARGRERLRRLCGRVPGHIWFVQGDIFSLPFRNQCFDLVMCQGLLHMFDDKAALLSELERVGRAEGEVSFTSLVGNKRLGRMYLSALQRAGEVASVETSGSLAEVLACRPLGYRLESIGNMMYASGENRKPDTT